MYVYTYSKNTYIYKVNIYTQPDILKKLSLSPTFKYDVGFLFLIIDPFGTL